MELAAVPLRLRGSSEPQDNRYDPTETQQIYHIISLKKLLKWCNCNAQRHSQCSCRLMLGKMEHKVLVWLTLDLKNGKSEAPVQTVDHSDS